MKDCIVHIFSNRSATLINDSKQAFNRLCILVIWLLGFITPHFVHAQHLDNRKRLDSFQRARTASTSSSIFRILANTYTVTGGGAYCVGGSGVVVGLNGSEQDTTYQLRLNGVNIGSPITGDGNPISFGLQTAAGTYTVFANTSTGPLPMSGSANIVINPLPTPSAGSNTPQCAGSTLNLTASGGSTYSWTGPNGFTSNSATPSISNVTTAASGVYTVTVTDGNGCSATTTTNVTINALPIPTAGSNTPQCSGSTLNLTASGGSTYSWTGPNGFTSNSATPSISNVTTAASGTYTVVVTNGNGCSATTTTNVTINALPTPTAGSNTPQCAGSTLNLTASGGSTYSWTGPNGFTSNSATPSISNVTTAASGVYTVTVTDGNGCSATTTTSVTINALPTPTAGSNTPQCAGSTLNLTASGGSTYSWTGPNGFTSNSATPSISNVTTAASGVYTVTVTGGNGCSATTTTSVTINALPTPTAGSNTPQCAGSTLNLTASGGSTYSWTGPNGFTSNSATPSISNVTTAASGTYTVVVTNGNGCSATTTTNVTINALPTPTAGSNTPQCAGSTLNLTASGGSTYGWTGPNGFTSNSATPSITNVSTAAAGTYTVTVTDGNGCSATATTNVTITPLPTANLSYAGTPFCRSVALAQPATLSGTNAYIGGTYSAAPGGLSINGSTGAITPSTSTAGTYTVTYTTPASGGCPAVIATTSVTITAVPTATISYSGTPFCTTLGSTPVTLSGTGAFTGGTYSAPAGLTINSSTGDITPSSSTPGTYTVTYVTPASGGCAAINATASVTITALPTVSLSYTGMPFCRSLATAQNPALTGTGAYTGGTYTATPAGLTIASTTGAITPSTSTAGTYTVTYTTPASGGCVAITATANVTITAVPTATISYTGTPFCSTVNSAPVTLSGTGAYTGGTYTATPAGLTINSSTGDITPSSSTAASYTVTYTIPASGGCAAVNVTTPVTITAAPTASLSYSGTPFCRSLAAGQNPTLTGTNAYTGGTYTAAPAGLSIVAGTGVITPSTSTAGTYTVTYTKAAAGGCPAVVATASVTITAVPTATISYTGTPFCTTVASATVTLTGTNAYTGGTFSAPAGLTINSSTGEITPLSSTPGTYTITYNIPASGGCAAINVTTSVTITAQPTANLSYTGTPFCRSVSTAQSPTLTGTGAYTGGTYSAAPAGLTISGTNGNITPSSSTAGTYTVTYTRAAAGGCAAVTATATVVITAVPTATISYTGTPFCTTVASAPVTLTGTNAYTGGTFSAPAGLTINATTGEITPSSSTAGTYTITYLVPASGGCATINATTSVTITAMPTANLTYAGNPFCRSVSTAQSPTLTGTGAYTGGTYSATPAGLTISAAGAITPSSSTAGTYTVTYTRTASGGCAAITTTTSVTITAVPVANAGPDQTGAATCGLTSVTLAANTPTAGTGSWSIISGTGGTITTPTSPTSTFTGTPGTTYTLRWTITNPPCAASTDDVIITFNQNPTTANAGTAQSFCAGGNATLAANAPTIGTGLWSVVSGPSTSTAQFSSITNPAATFTPAGGAGSYVLRWTISNAPCTASTSNVTITVNALPTVPTISAGGATTFCQGGSVTLTSSASSGNQWSLNGTPVSGATNQTYSATTSGSYTVTVTNVNGCSRTSAATSVTVNPSPTITVSPAAPSAFCSGGSVTLTASGANTYTWAPTEGLSITTGATVIATPEVTTTYTVTGTGANGCTNTATVTVTVTPTPDGSITSSPPVCSGNNSGTIILSNYTGTIVRWESSTNGGASWTNISNTSTTQSYSNLTQTTIYRVLLTLNNGCDGYSDVGIVPVNEPFTPTVTVNPPIICQGQSATLRASDYGAPPFPTEDFGNANPAGWSGNDANNNNEDENTDWGETGDGKVRSGKVYNSQAPPTNTKFMIVAGTTDGADQTAALITPPFSLVGVVNPIFGYMTALDFNAGTVGKVEVSIDGGATYITLETFTGPAKVGDGNNGFVQRNYNLSAYIGQPDVRVRFNYFGTTGSIWAVDNVGLQGTFEPVTYQWSPLNYVTPAAGNTQTITVTPPAGTHPYCVVATTGAGCASQSVCGNVEVKPLPTCSITGNNPVCPGSTNIYSAPAIAGYTYSWTISGGATISGSATGQTVTVVANNTCGTYTLTLTTTLNGCSSAPCTLIVNKVDNTAPVATAPATQSFQCLADVPAAGTLTATDNCSGNITSTGVDVRVANGCGYTITRTWTFTDACNNTTSVSQIINVLDNIAPVAPAAPASQSFQCLANVPAPGTLTATDNCSGNITATGVDVQVAKACGYTITRTWTFTDACNNTSSVSQTINVQDDIPPVITCPPAQVFCAISSNTYTIPPATASDNCIGTLTITYQITGATTRNGTGNDASGVFNVGISTITWTVTDVCGNTSTCTTTVTINPKPAPIIYHN